MFIIAETNQTNLTNKKDYQDHLVRKLSVAIRKLTSLKYRRSKKRMYKVLLLMENNLVIIEIITNQTITKINNQTPTAHQAQSLANQTFLIEKAKHQ